MTQAATEAAMQEPRVGDRFTELLSYWVYVCSVSPQGIITTIEGYGAPEKFPEVGSVKQFKDAAEFRERFRFSTIPGYWVELYDRDNAVERWIERAFVKRK